MRTTEAIISFDLVDTTAKDDATFSAGANRSFAAISLLKQDIENDNSYMTGEWNFSLLDGSQKYFPVSPSIPFYSSVLSGPDCLFSPAPSISVSFKENHSSAGLTLKFLEDYPRTVKVEWLDNNGRQIEGVVFYPNEKNYFCSCSVKEYRSLKVTFLESLHPYRSIKLMNMKFGKEIVCKNDDLSEAKITEELNPISSELSINTLAFTMHDQSKDFNVLNPKGIYSMLQPNQQIDVKEIVDGETFEMGTFYLNTWKSKSETQITFNCIDAIGVLDKTDFKKGKIYNDVPAGTIIKEIMQSAGWTNYQVSAAVSAKKLSGYIPVCTHRQALQQVAFAARAVADTSRSDYINIYEPNPDVNHRIKNDRLFLEGDISVREYVSSISIVSHKYKKSTTLEKAYDGTLPVGTTEIHFSNPYTSLAISGGVLVESSFNYAVVKMSLAGTCVIEGYKYEDQKTTLTYEVENVPAGELKKTVSVKDATLISESNARIVAENLLAYYYFRKEATQRFILEYERVGRWFAMLSQQDFILAGCAEKMSVDLAGGFLADATVVGYNTSDGDPVYAGKEIYTGERIGVI